MDDTADTATPDDRLTRERDAKQAPGIIQKCNSSGSDPVVIARKRLADGNTIREVKRKKWMAKQERREQLALKEKSRQAWVKDNSRFVSFVTKQDLEGIRMSPLARAETKSEARQNETSNKHIDRNRTLRNLLIPYVDIKDGSVIGLGEDPCHSKKRKMERAFIAEGVETIRLLIQQSVTTGKPDLSPIQVKSIFVKPSSLFDEPVHLLRDVEAAVEEASKNEVAQDRCPPFHVLIGSEATLSSVAGFPIARGALACGLVPEDRDEDWLKRFIHLTSQDKKCSIRLVALDGICDVANLGSIVRTASAFGVTVIILSDDCCDAWYRRSIRVSMGHVFVVPVVRVKCLASTILRLSTSEPSFATYASVVDVDSDVLVLENVERGSVPRSWCCVLGNEVRFSTIILTS